jgi:hypothetical protein
MRDCSDQITADLFSKPEPPANSGKVIEFPDTRREPAPVSRPPGRPLNSEVRSRECI